jgi:uncharacterized RDD family membrane protein YckC
MSNIYAPSDAPRSQLPDHGATGSPFWRRLLAALVDVAIVVAFTVMLAPLMHGAKGTWIAFEIWSGMALFLYNMMPAVFNGQTLGKRLLRIRIVSDRYFPIGWAKAFMRASLPGFQCMVYAGATVVVLLSMPDSLFSALLPHELGERVRYLQPPWLDDVMVLGVILIAGLEFGAFMVTQRGQRLSDLIAGTVVINVKREGR